ncbi:unnamed protein product [Moneuplotes crassus]|uniref:Uncharacterized protein n=1 Tax=Euplotes crassus TaxID=5936 RepID=A0AAD1TZI7_EUPCR|nr:unnamed protein product [Moneuplotes crassus]
MGLKVLYRNRRKSYRRVPSLAHKKPNSLSKPRHKRRKQSTKDEAFDNVYGSNCHQPPPPNPSSFADPGSSTFQSTSTNCNAYSSGDSSIYSPNKNITDTFGENPDKFKRNGGKRFSPIKFNKRKCYDFVRSNSKQTKATQKIKLQKVAQMKLFKGPFCNDHQSSLSSSRKTTERMYKPHSRRSHRSKSSIGNYSSQNSLEGKKIPIINKYSEYFDLEKKQSSYKNKIRNKVAQSFADMFFENQKVFKNALLKFNVATHCYEENVKPKVKKKSARRNKLVKSQSKQKIVLKIPTMISVCMEKPILNIEKSQKSEKLSDSSENSDSLKLKLRKNKRYSKMRKNMSKIEKIARKVSRQQLKIKERNVNQSVQIPAQAAQNPLVKNSYKTKNIRRNGPLIECALSQLRRSKEYQTLDISKDGRRDSNLDYKTKNSMMIDQKTNAMNNQDIDKSTLSIEQRKQNKSAVKSLVYCSTVQSIGKKISEASIEKISDIEDRKKSISMLNNKIEPYKNLPKIKPIKEKIISDTQKKVLKARNDRRRNSGRNTKALNQDIQEFKQKFNTIQNSAGKVKPKPLKMHKTRKNTVVNDDEPCFGTYSVVDLLQRPAIASQYIPSKGFRSFSGRKNRNGVRSNISNPAKKSGCSFIMHKESPEKLRIS